MSLDTLRALRRSGSRPDGLLKVVVGRHSTAGERPDVIAVAPEDRAQFLDWRAVVGLPFALFVCDGATAQAEQVFDALLTVNAKPAGACWRDGAVTADEATAPTLQRMWEALCL